MSVKPVAHHFLEFGRAFDPVLVTYELRWAGLCAKLFELFYRHNAISLIERATATRPLSPTMTSTEELTVVVPAIVGHAKQGP